MGDVVMRADGVSKKFARRIRHNMLYGTVDVARGMLGMGARTDVLRPGEFWAVQDVSFELKRGETLGLIGPNGSGKSTLLRLLNGIYQPDKGRIEIKGRVGALIAVGAGFHPLMTGRENIYLNGSILGMTKAEIDRNFDAIVNFADIGEFLDAPVKTYSSGMHVRLGFAIAIHCEPDILLVDEILAVGDTVFQQRCYSKIQTMKEEGRTIILVTHNMDAIVKHTKNAMLLQNGRRLSTGSPRDVVGEYYGLLWRPADRSLGEADDSRIGLESLAGEAKHPKKTLTGSTKTTIDVCHLRPDYNPGEHRFGNAKAAIINYRLLRPDDTECRFVESGETVRFVFDVLFNEDVHRADYGFLIRSKDGMDVYGTSTRLQGITTVHRNAGEVEAVEFCLAVPLSPGDYFISAGVVEFVDGDEAILDRRRDMVHFVVRSDSNWSGIVNLNSDIRTSAVGHNRADA